MPHLTATPGPWLDGKPNFTDGPSTESGSHVIYSGSQEIARVYGDKGLPVKANARLIAAAPETAQERDRLKALNAAVKAECARLRSAKEQAQALNAELVEALERTVCALEEVAEDGGTIYDETMGIARTALAKARKED